MTRYADDPGSLERIDIDVLIARLRFIEDHRHLIVPLLFDPDEVKVRSQILLDRQWHRQTPQEQEP